MRALLTALGIAVGVAAVVLLTSIGEGVRRFVVAEFTQFGTNIINITPGTTQTMGGSIGCSVPCARSASTMRRRCGARRMRPRRCRWCRQCRGRGQRRKRRVTVYGVGYEFATAFRFEVGAGSFLPRTIRARRAASRCSAPRWPSSCRRSNALGASIRVGSERYRVVGVMRSKGTMIGFDLDDTVYLPAARALELFDRDSLFEIDVLYEEAAPVDEVVDGIRRVMVARHGDEDFTITTQQQMLDTLGSVLGVLTFAVAALAASRCWSGPWASSPS